MVILLKRSLEANRSKVFHHMRGKCISMYFNIFQIYFILVRTVEDNFNKNGIRIYSNQYGV